VDSLGSPDYLFTDRVALASCNYDLCSLLVSHYYGRGPRRQRSGAPNGRGPGFIEPAEPMEIKSNNAALIVLLSFLLTRLSHIGANKTFSDISKRDFFLEEMRM